MITAFWADATAVPLPDASCGLVVANYLLADNPKRLSHGQRMIAYRSAMAWERLSRGGRAEERQRPSAVEAG